MFVSEGKAKSIIEQKAVIERYSAETIHKKADTGHGLTITLQDLEKMITDEDQGAGLPYLKLKNEQTSAGKSQNYQIYMELPYLKMRVWLAKFPNRQQGDYYG